MSKTFSYLLLITLAFSVLLSCGVVYYAIGGWLFVIGGFSFAITLATAAYLKIESLVRKAMSK